jgi:hypothetical protein
MIELEVDFNDPPGESFEVATPVARLTSTEARESIRSGIAQATLMGGGSAHAAAVGRTLPHSLEAEEYLLSLCLLDGDDVVARCIEAHIRPESFYDPKHGIVFEHILGLYNRKVPIELSTIGEELKAARELDAVGGYAFLMQVSGRIPTTANASYFIEKVREQALLREIIRSSTRTVEECYNFSGGIDEFVATYQGRARELADQGSSTSAADIMARAFNPKKLLTRPAPIYSVADTTICTRGNLTTIYSQAKTGKSSFIAAMIAAALTNPTSGVDTLGVTGPNYGKGAVLHFDTEQSPYDWQQLVNSCLRRAELPEPPAWLMSFTIAGMEAQKAERFVHNAVRLARKTHGSIHSIFIDGVADLVNDPNSPDECFPLVARLHGLAIEYDTAIVNILHLNPTAKDKSDKGRGHLGSQLERKCESNLTLKKDGDVTVVCAEGRQRGKPIPPDKSPAFRWSDEHGMHRSCSMPKAEGDTPRNSGGRPQTYEYATYADLMPKKTGGPGMPLSQLAKRLSVNKPITPKQLYNVLARWEEEGLIEVVSSQSGRTYRQAV